jgi:DNA-binding NarL/FixJ family response regulator
VLHADTSDALDALADFTEEHPHVPVVAIIDSVDVISVARVIRAGATTVLADSATDVRSAVEAALAGNSLLPFEVVGSMAGLVPDDQGLSRWLTDEERSWLRSMAAGETVADVAESVGYSERAMFRQLKSLYRRLGVSNRTEALLWAAQRGILDLE